MPLGHRYGVRSVEDAKHGIVAAALAVPQPDHLATIAGGEIAEHMMGRGLDTQGILAGLKILPLIGARQLILAGDDLEAEAEAIVDDRDRDLPGRACEKFVLPDLLAEGRPRRRRPAVADVLKDALSQTSEEYYSNVFRRYELRDKVRLFFEQFDLLLTPTLPSAAFDVGLNTPPILPDRNIVSWVYYTYPFNLTGQPAASIPAGFTRAGLPVGLQMVAKINRETDIFRAAAAFETAKPWAAAKPPGFAS